MVELAMGLANERRGGRRAHGLRARGACIAVAAALIAALAVTAEARAEGPHVASGSTAVSPDKVKRAKALNNEAHELYLRGQYHSAIEKVEAAITLDPDGADLVYNLAVIYERLGELDKSERAYRRSLELETDPALRERTRTNVKRIEGAKREVAAKAAAPEGAIAPRASPTPPPRVPGASAPQREAPFLGGRSPWLIPAASISATALAMGVGLGISAVVRNPGPAATTGNGTSILDIDREAQMAHLHAVLADVSFAVGAAAAGAAFYLYFFGPRTSNAAAKGRDARPALHVALDVGLRRAALRVVF
jgi:tetratricopeptide (TPR) repeat protein